MTAHSVTGKGPGAAQPSDRNTLVPLMNPRVVAAGKATTDGGGGATIWFPIPLPGGWDNYSIQVTPSGDGSGPFGGAVGGAEDERGLVNITVFTPDPSTEVHYTVTSIGFAFTE